MIAYRKLSQAPGAQSIQFMEREPLSFPSLKRDDEESDLIFDFVPHKEVPETRWEKFKNDIIKQLQQEQYRSGPVDYDAYRNVGRYYVPRESPQAIPQISIFRE